MNFAIFNAFLVQLADQWRGLKVTQKIGFISFVCLLPLFTFFFFQEATFNHDVVLFSAEQMRHTDLAKVKSYLDSMNLSYKVNADNLLVVPKEQEQQIRLELAVYGLPKESTEKGYDLFDSTTWIKGEKELQILELRAIKGQLEQDISHFENIRKANVIIDIPPPRSFGAVSYKTKASVILDLVPGARLSQQELRAITYHIAGAVRGLVPDMIAISDTNGKLYQGLDYDGVQDSIRSAEIAAEDYIKAKIDGMLTTILGFDNFYTTVQVLMSRDKVVEERKIHSGTVDGISLGQPVVSSVTKSNDQQTRIQDALINSHLLQPQGTSEQSDAQETEQLAVPLDHVKIISSPGQIRSISIGVLVDERLINPEVFSYRGEYISTGLQKEDLKRSIENQLNTILKGYKVGFHQTVDFVPFDRVPSTLATNVLPVTQNETSPRLSNTILITLMSFVSFIVLLILFKILRSPTGSGLPQERKFPRTEDQKSLSELEEVLDTLRQPQNFSKEDKKNSPLKGILQTADAKQLATFFEDETPQTVALILYHLNPERLTTVLSNLPQSKQEAVLVSLTQLEDLDEWLKYAYSKEMAEVFDEKDFIGHKYKNTSLTALQVIKQFPKEKQEELLVNIRKLDSHAAEKIEKFLLSDKPGNFES